MPSSRAVLFDIEKSNLDPKKEHKNLNKKGNIVAKKEKSKNSVEKLGLVFLEEKNKKNETALVDAAVSSSSKEKPVFQNLNVENLEKEVQSLNQEIEQELSTSLEENNENKNLLEEQKSQTAKNKKVNLPKSKI